MEGLELETEAAALAAVRESGWELCFVPMALMSEEVCMAAAHTSTARRAPDAECAGSCANSGP